MPQRPDTVGADLPVRPQDEPVSDGTNFAPYIMSGSSAARQSDKSSDTSAADVAGMFVRSLTYSALQTPIDGVTQLFNDITSPIARRQLLPRLQMIDAPKQTEFGSAEWTARLAGGGIGTILPFWLGGKAAVRVAESARGLKYIGPLIERAGILEQNSVAQLAFKGAIYEGIFHPVDESSGNVALQRGVNFTSGALSFMAMGKANEWLRGTALGKAGLGSAWRGIPLATELFVDATSGATAGVSDTVIHSLANGDAPNGKSLAQSAGEYAIMSMFLRLGRLPVEKAAREKPPQLVDNPDAAARTPRDPNSLRPRLPFDTTKIRKTVLSTGEQAEVFAVERGSGRKLLYREMPDDVNAARVRMTAEEFDSSGYQTVRHRGQDYAIGEDGKAYAIHQVDGAYELVFTDKVILERLNEVQVPWPPIQANDKYRAPNVIRLNDILAMWAHNAAK